MQSTYNRMLSRIWSHKLCDRASVLIWVVYFLHILHFSKVISPSVSLAQVFSCEFCEISKKIFFTEHLRVTTSLTEHSIWNQNSSYSVDVCGVLILVIYGFIKRFSVMLVHIICFVVFNSQEFFFLILLLFNSTVVQTQIDKIYIRNNTNNIISKHNFIEILYLLSL